MKRGRIIFAVSASILFALIVAHCTRFTEIDVCLDAGGQWDYDTATCQGAIEQD